MEQPLAAPMTATAPPALAPTARWALASLALTMLMPSLDTSIANAGLPALAQAFDASFPAVQWIVLAYLLAITTLIVSVGRLGDAIGRRRLLAIGIALFTAASLLCGLAPTLPILIAARAAQGLGAAIMMALTVALVGETVPKARIGSAMGILGTMSAIGTTLGPSLGGLMIGAYGWRSIFLVNVPVGVVNLALALRYLPRDPERPDAARRPFDTTGTILLALTLAAYALAMTGGRGHLDPRSATLLAVAILGSVLFVMVEKRAASPLVDLALFRDRALSAGLAMSALVSTVMMATLVVGPFYLTRALQLPTAIVGLVLSVGPLAAAIAGVPAGRLVDRFGTQRMTVAGLGAITTGLTIIALLPARFGVLGYVLPLVVSTSGYALFQAANNTAIMRDVVESRRGVTAGMLTLSRNLGLVTGASAMGAVFALSAGAADIALASPGAVGTGMRITYGIAAALVVLAMVLATIGTVLPSPAVRGR